MSKITYDLIKDGIWDKLAFGKHTVSVVACAIGYENSDEASYIFRKEDTDRMNVQLYQCTAEHNRVNKTDYMKQMGALYGVLRDETSIISPDIIVQGDIPPNFNYVYIKDFNRYYYVTDITAVRNQLWNISLDVDVLMSYNMAIRSCTAYVDRNEFTYEKLLVDNKVSFKQGETISEDFIDNSLFNDSPLGGSYVIQGVGVSIDQDNVKD